MNAPSALSTVEFFKERLKEDDKSVLKFIVASVSYYKDFCKLHGVKFSD